MAWRFGRQHSHAQYSLPVWAYSILQRPPHAILTGIRLPGSRRSGRNTISSASLWRLSISNIQWMWIVLTLQMPIFYPPGPPHPWRHVCSWFWYYQLISLFQDIDTPNFNHLEPIHPLMILWSVSKKSTIGDISELSCSVIRSLSR